MVLRITVTAPSSSAMEGSYIMSNHGFNSFGFRITAPNMKSSVMVSCSMGLTIIPSLNSAHFLHQYYFKISRIAPSSQSPSNSSINPASQAAANF